MNSFTISIIVIGGLIFAKWLENIDFVSIDVGEFSRTSGCSSTCAAALTLQNGMYRYDEGEYLGGVFETINAIR